MREDISRATSERADASRLCRASASSGFILIATSRRATAISIFAAPIIVSLPSVPGERNIAAPSVESVKDKSNMPMRLAVRTADFFVAGPWNG